MADVTAKALISVYGDTSNAVKEINKLTDSQKKLGDGLKETGKGFAGFVDGLATGFAKFNLALGGVQAAFGLLNKSMDAAVNQARLDAMQKMLPTGSVDRFRDATDRLISRQDVLRLSVKGLSGDFKLTEQEMTTVLKTAVALEQRGFGPAAATADKLLEALAQGVNKLDDFGINLEKTKDRQADVNAAMEKFRGIISDTPIDAQTASMAQLRDNLNEIAVAMERVVAVFAGALGAIARDWNEYAGDLFGQPAVNAAQGRARDAQAKLAGARFYADVVGAESPSAAMLAMDRQGRPYGYQALSNDEYATSIIGSMGGTVGTGAIGLGSASRPRGGGRPRETLGSFGTGEAFSGDLGGGYGVGGPINFGSSGVLNQAGTNFLNPSLGDGGSWMGGTDANSGGQKALAFMEQLQSQATMTGAAFGVFTDAFSAAVGAAIDGSEGIARAFGKAAQAGLKALAVEYAVRALGEGAFALSSLAFGDVKGAAAHGLAAGKFALAAAAAGVGSAAIGSAMGGGGGGGGSPGPAGGGFAGSRGGGGSGGGGGGDTIVINIGDGFYGDSAAVEQAVAKGVRSGKRRGARGDDFSTRFSG